MVEKQGTLIATLLLPGGVGVRRTHGRYTYRYTRRYTQHKQMIAVAAVYLQLARLSVAWLECQAPCLDPIAAAPRAAVGIGRCQP